MSDFGMFESDEATQDQPRLAARTAAVKLEAAIDTVRAQFGRFLLGATGIDEFGDRWHYSKHDIRAAVEPYVFPNTGTMRRIQNAMKQDWKLAHPYKVAGGPDIDPNMSVSNAMTWPDDKERNRFSIQRIPGERGPGQPNSAIMNHDATELMSADGQHHWASRRQALSHDEAGFGSMPEGDSHRNQDLDQTYHPSSGNLIPDGDFEGWKDSVDQNGPEKVEANDFTPGGDSGSDRREAAALVADIYTDFARSNGLRVASLDTLDLYANTGIHEADYRLLESMIVRAAEKCEDDEDEDESDDEDDDEEDSDSADSGGGDFGGGEDSADDDEDADPEESDSDSGSGGGGGNPFGGEGGGDAPESGGGQTFTVPEEAPQLPPEMMQEIPSNDPGGSAPVPPEVIDSLLGLPEGTIEQLLLEEAQQGGEDPGMSGPPAPPQGGGDDFLGEAGGDADQPPDPRMARRRQATAVSHGPEGEGSGVTTDTYTGKPYRWNHFVTVTDKDGNERKSVGRYTNTRTDYLHPDRLEPDFHDKLNPRTARTFWAAPDESEDELTERQKRDQKNSIDTQHENWLKKQKAARMFWAADDDQNSDSGDSGGGDSSGGGQQAPAQDPAAGGMDPSMMAQMGGGMMPPPGSQAVAPPQPPMPLENQPAEDALLDTANQAIMQMIDRETAEYQQIIGPLSQALQAVQFAQQVEQAEAPMDVTPPQGTVNVNPSAAPGGAQNPMQQTAARLQHLTRRAKIQHTLSGAARVIANTYGVSESMLREAMGRRQYEHVAEAFQILPPQALQTPEVRAAANHIGKMFAAENPMFNSEVWMDSVVGPASGSRHPFDQARAAGYRQAGETLKNTPTMDAYEHPKAGQVPEITDNLTINDLPQHQFKGLPKPKKNSRKVGLSLGDKVQRWMQKQTEQGLNTGGDPMAEKYLNTHKVGPRGQQEVHQAVGAPEHPYVEEPPNPKANPAKAINPVTKKGHRKTATDSLYLRHKENGRHGVGYRLFPGPNGWNDHSQLGVQVKWDEDPLTWGPEDNPDTEDAVHRTDKWPFNEVGYTHYDRKLYPLSDFHVLDSVPGKFDPDATQDPFDPREFGASKEATWGEWEPPKTASFFTRKVPGWKWDDHLNGYLSKEGKAFTCSCGQKVAAPSYKSCDCGKIWNVYAIGDTHHLASDSADMFIAREIPVRPGVIMANRKMAGAGDCDWCYGHMPTSRWEGASMAGKEPPFDHLNVCADCEATLPKDKYQKFVDEVHGGQFSPRAVSQFVKLHGLPIDEHDNLWDWSDYLQGMQQRNRQASRKQAKDGECTCWDGYCRVPGTKPCAEGSCRKCDSGRKESSFRIAEMIKYNDDTDPVVEAYGKNKVPSTTVPQPPKDWATRLPKGDPSKRGGTWTPPTIPRKSK